MRADQTVLSDRGVIEVAGPDARSFLQRLVTSDVETLGPGEARYTALLTPQGKIISDFFVVAPKDGDDVLYLDVPGALVETLAKRLTLYRLRAKVAITDRVAVETMLTAASSSQVTHNSRPSGLSARRRGRLPTGMLARTRPLATSITCTRPATSEVT